MFNHNRSSSNGECNLFFFGEKYADFLIVLLCLLQMFNAEMRNAKNCNAKNTTRYKDFMAQSTVIFEGGIYDFFNILIPDSCKLIKPRKAFINICKVLFYLF